MIPTRKRLEKEYYSLRQAPHPGYIVSLLNSDLFTWHGSLQGLKKSPYEGGTFSFHVQFTEDYPTEPPKLNFTTKIYHPNVDGKTGAVSWKMLGRDWHHNHTMEKVLLSLRMLLDHPELESAVEVGLANELANRREAYLNHAKGWTERCAMPNSVSTEFT
ncbi:hypothetical protein CFE70_001768 [Pyrenophora teres f. teres 0-1]|uniref:UBC core domain-containing protein n=2 Tax=Pyrenophora teres f. teres TaxID=97479 RepID=E3S818_PYRTT|nr:hypothetical protein PTT_19030 [Pyrenophora teres f. teres 0-1]KAE8842318.1 hypothetical protein HRS9139_01615 [Pyrenophora teres f. teres]KAE8850610.1 hypothetical protein PTNB85_01026 [Pyrenophora teres f. teres]KAE8851357.1 hypothetical protein HRS9122_01644 [Pyrenophora teres f. teres]KAE8870028.1 hypothetical protein PTNB29_00372 [Pyrenophora teres f. teres]